MGYSHHCGGSSGPSGGHLCGGYGKSRLYACTSVIHEDSKQYVQASKGKIVSLSGCMHMSCIELLLMVVDA